MKERPNTGASPIHFDPDNPDTDALYTTAKVAELFGVTTETVRDWLAKGKLRGIRLETGQYRVRRADLMAFANKTFGLEAS